MENLSWLIKKIVNSLGQIISESKKAGMIPLPQVQGSEGLTDWWCSQRDPYDVGVTKLRGESS